MGLFVRSRTTQFSAIRAVSLILGDFLQVFMSLIRDVSVSLEPHPVKLPRLMDSVLVVLYRCISGCVGLPH